MKYKASFARMFRVLAPAAALALPALAADQVAIPEEEDLPFYATGLGHTTDGWVGTVFYRPLEKAPGDIMVNQFVFVDPLEYPLSVQGSLIRKQGQFFPQVVRVVNSPGQCVEIAFTRAEEYLPIMEGGTRLDELLALPSLIVGYADYYTEIQQPQDAEGEQFHVGTVASGVLEDGRHFWVHSVYTAGTFHMDLRVSD